MDFENLIPKIFRREEKPRQETSPKEKYKSSSQEVVLESRDFERQGELLGGIIGNARFVKIRDDGGVFSNLILTTKMFRRKKPYLYQEKEPLI